jgi:hypothetical protein
MAMIVYVRLIHNHDELYNLQPYVMKGGQLLVKDLRVLLFPSSIKTGSHDITEIYVGSKILFI